MNQANSISLAGSVPIQFANHTIQTTNFEKILRNPVCLLSIKLFIIWFQLKTFKKCVIGPKTADIPT